MADYLMENQTLEFEDMGNHRNITITDDNVFSLTAGNKYTVVWDGVPYTCFACGTGIATYLGNEGLLSSGSVDTGEPFCMYYYISSGSLNISTVSEESTHVVSVYQNEDQSGYLVTDNTVAFSLDSSYGMYLWQVAADGIYFGLIPDETYTVVWDGTRYLATAVETSLGTATGIALGNLGLFGLGDDNGQPFLFAYSPVSTGSMGTIMCYTTEMSDTHTFSVYRGELTDSDDSGGDSTEDGYLLNDTFQFSYNSEASAYFSTITDNPPAIVAGNTYTVTWGTRRYVCTAYNGTIAGGENTWNAIYLGNNSIIGTYATGDGDSSDANLPFLYAYVPEQSAGSTTITSSGNFYTPDFAPVYDIKLYNGLDNPDGYLMYQLTLTFEKEESESHYNYAGNGMPAITADKVYTVVWDGKFFTRTAYSITDPLAGEMICLGSTNIADESYEDTEEPFLYAYATQSDSGYAIFGTLNNSSEHIVSIYEGELKPSVENKSLYFDTDASGGKLTANLSNPFMPVEAGDTYVVTWDENEEFTCTAKEAVVPLYGIDTNCVVLGNLSIADESAEDTKEPFLYAYCADEVTCEFNLTEPGVHTEAIGYTWYKILDAAPSYEQILDAEFTLSAGGETPITGSVTASQCLINDYRGCAFMIESEGLGFIVAYCSGTIEHAIATIDIPEKGFYLAGPPVDNFIQFSGGLKASNFAWFTIPETSENEHIVSMRAADTTQPDEPSDPNLPENVNIVLLDKTGARVVYYGIKTVSFDTDVTGQRATFVLNKISGGE